MILLENEKEMKEMKDGRSDGFTNSRRRSMWFQLFGFLCFVCIVQFFSFSGLMCKGP